MTTPPLTREQAARIREEFEAVASLGARACIDSAMLAVESALASVLPAPSTEQEHWLSRKAWSWIRAVLTQGGAIQQDYDAGNFKDRGGYEGYSARLDEAARERADELSAAISNAPTKETASAATARPAVGGEHLDCLRCFAEQGRPIDRMVVCPMCGNKRGCSQIDRDTTAGAVSMNTTARMTLSFAFACLLAAPAWACNEVAYTVVYDPADLASQTMRSDTINVPGVVSKQPVGFRTETPLPYGCNATVRAEVHGQVIVAWVNFKFLSPCDIPPMHWTFTQDASGARSGRR